MKNTPLRKIGKIGQANILARKKIAEIAEENNINICEIKLQGCLVNFALAPAHRHKRIWYKGNIDLLSDFNQWICACVVCHDKIENNEKLTEEVFKRCRP